MNEEHLIRQPYDEISQGIYFILLLMIFTGIALFVALIYNQRSLVIFSLILLILGIGLRVWSRLSLKNLHYSASVNRSRIFPGEKASLTIDIENNKLLPVILKLKLTLTGMLVSDQEEMVITENSGMLWYQRLSIHRELRPEKRGIYKTGSPRLITGDFFGFFPKLKTIRHNVDITVYPRLIPLKPFPILKQIMFGKPANTSPVQDPIYLLGTRDYRDMSPARNIHWKASARHGKLQEKIFEPTEQEKILLILEADGFNEKDTREAFEKSIEVIASLAVLLDSQHYAVGFLTNCSTIRAGQGYQAITRGASHIPNLLETLAGIQPDPLMEIERLLQANRQFPIGVSCMYFSYQPGSAIRFLYETRIPAINITAVPENQINTDQGDAGSGLRYGLIDLLVDK
ncbi:DUF58 domain-containing protein [bacterium]|nr:DUF58 domain-containing protein [bacterium]